MPSKSNKFDFTNRTSLGLKMGQIVGNVLEKEADKALKEAERQSIKARKQSCANLSEARECYTHTTHLDIRVPGKQLGDDGTSALLAGLEAALRNGTEAVHLALEDLNLNDNGITTASLRRMAPVISLACRTFKTLNLSNNKIEVDSEQQMQDWEYFLDAFTHCLSFCRLDLTGNTKLGSKALETLAKLHVRADDVPPVRRPDQGWRDSFDLGNNLSQCLGQPTEIRDTCSGLRSIPYLVLNDTGLDDAGALWLSYVIEDHLFPSQLQDNQDAEARHYKSSQDGIEWRGNDDTLSKDGHGLLTRAEGIRQQLSEDGHSLDAADLKSGEQESRLLSSGRRKLQRAVIANRGGVGTVDLWHAAVKVVCLSRVFARKQGYVRGWQEKSPVAMGPGIRERRNLNESRAEQRSNVPLFSPLSENIKPSGSDKSAYSIVGHLQNLKLEPAARPSLVGTSFLAYQRRHIEKTLCSRPSGAFQVEECADRLPLKIVQCIIAHVLSSRERDALTPDQFENAVRWGQDRATLHKELEWLKDHRSIQIMRLLENIACMEYARL